jgi:hypothetical protein
MACVLVNIATLAGADFINALLVIWPVMMALFVVLCLTGFYSQAKGWKAFNTPSWRSVDRKWIHRRLPTWSRYVVWVSWAYSAVGVGTMFVYFATHGQVHGDQYYYAYQQSRPATPFEIQREHGFVLFGFSSFAVQFFIYPALYFLFERRGKTDEAV